MIWTSIGYTGCCQNNKSSQDSNNRPTYLLADHQRNYLEIEVLLLLPPILSKPTINRTFCEVVVAQALPKVLFVYQKYARNLRQVGQFSLPLFYCLGLDIFSFTSDIGSNAQLGLRTTVFQNIFRHLIVSVRSFDKELRLVF